jgi:hypothetical protein
LKRLNVALDLCCDFVLSNFQIEVGLKVHPERGAVLEVARKVQRRAGNNSPALVDIDRSGDCGKT